MLCITLLSLRWHFIYFILFLFLFISLRWQVVPWRFPQLRHPVVECSGTVREIPSPGTPSPSSMLNLSSHQHADPLL